MRTAPLALRIAAALALVAAICIAAATVRAANPNALWEIVHGQCVPEYEQHGDPAPCAEVDLKNGVAHGYAVLKDIVGIAQFLLIPTERISGIESPALLRPGAVNYFASAWQARSFTEKALGRPMPPDTISLAVNSKFGRSQNLLHIHIDCIRADVRETLRGERGQIAGRWALLPEPLAGYRYRAIGVTSLDGQDPFALLAAGVPGARSDMGRYTLVVTAIEFGAAPGFVVLAHRADPAFGDRGSGEELQDHACALAH
jgi:CDP-diacylglycerol pyrophosphatase